MLVYSDISIILAAKHSLVSFHILKNMYDLLLLYLSGSVCLHFFKRFVYLYCMCLGVCLCACLCTTLLSDVCEAEKGMKTWRYKWL